MLRRAWKSCIAICAVGGLLFVAAPAAAIGYYNQPGNFCQCFGYGNGAGYHSCLVLGPSNCRGCCDHHEVRLACPPQSQCGCYGDGNYGDCYAPPQNGPSTVPPEQRQTQRTPAAMWPLILR